MTNQPMPVRSKASMAVSPLAGVQFNKTLTRQCAKGEAKYGTVLMTFNSRDAHADALAEIVDAVQYVTQARMEREEIVRVAKLMAETLRLRTHADYWCDDISPVLAAWDELGLESEGE